MTDRAIDELADDLFPAHLHIDDQSAEDAALERYLGLLDEYTRHRSQLTKHLGEGFIQLSRANYASGKQFGRDHWDLRVKATRKFNVSKKSVAEATAVPVLTSVDENSGVRQRRKESQADAAGKTQTKKEKRPYDPIQMFGRLVPYQLRDSQKEFSSAVDSIEKCIKTMRELDEAIRVLDSMGVLYDESLHPKSEPEEEEESQNEKRSQTVDKEALVKQVDAKED